MAPDSFSQFGEDRLVWDFFGGRRDGYFIEVGANDPISLSQTYLLEQNGWTGLLVEPHPEKAEALRRARDRSRVAAVAAGRAGETGEVELVVPGGDDHIGRIGGPAGPRDTVWRVPVRSLDSLLEEEPPARVDFCSIDVEGAEMEVLEGFSLERYQPALLLIEDHLQTLDLHRYLMQHGYRLIERTGCNGWYVPQGSVPGLPGFVTSLRLLRKYHLSHPFRWWRQRWRKAV